MGRGVLIAKFKVHLLVPVTGERRIAHGRMVEVECARTHSDVFAESEGQERLIARLAATLITGEGRECVLD